MPSWAAKFQTFGNGAVMGRKWEESGYQLDHAVVDKPLRGMAENLIAETKENKGGDLDSDAKFLIHFVLQVSFNTYKTICFLCADSDDCPSRKISYVADVPVLARTLIDELILILYIGEDPRQRTLEYLKSGWRELNAELMLYKGTHGAEPEWKAWIQENEQFCEDFAKSAKVSADERKNPDKILHFPHPGRIISRSMFTDPRHNQFSSYLNTWFYAAMSQMAHLNSWPGMAHRAHIIIRDLSSQTEKSYAEKAKSDALMQSIVLFLSLLCECSILLKASYTQQLKYIWGLLTSTDLFLFAKELYEFRYQKIVA